MVVGLVVRHKAARNLCGWRSVAIMRDVPAREGHVLCPQLFEGR